MARTNLTLDRGLLDEAWRLSGEKTCSGTVERALAASGDRIKARQILELACSGLWTGDLAEMRDDRPPQDPARVSG